MIEVTYHLTADDFYQAILAYRDRGRVMRFSSRFLTVIGILMVPMVVFVAVMKPEMQMFHQLVPFVAIALFWVGFFWWMPKWSATKQFKGSPASQGQVTLTASTAGVRIKSQQSESNSNWNAYIRWLENKRVIVLFTSPLVFVVIPKQSFSEDQLTSFRALLRDNITTQ